MNIDLYLDRLGLECLPQYGHLLVLYLGDRRLMRDRESGESQFVWLRCSASSELSFATSVSHPT